jgi:hypothetical protein
VVSDDSGQRLMLANAEGDVLASRTLHEAPADDTLEPADEPLLSNSGSKLPVDAARGADGRWWVINTPPCICSGEIVQFDARGVRTGRVALDGFEDPRALAMIDNRLLLADQEGVRLGSYDTSTGTLSTATGAGFLAELVGVVALRARGNASQNFLLAGVVLVPLLDVVPLVMSIFLLVQLQPGLSDPSRLDDARVVVALIFLAILSLAGLCIIIAILRRGHRVPRLGIDGTHVYCEPLHGKPTSVPVSEVMTDGTMLLVGRTNLRLHDARNDHFDRDAISSLILARLPPGAYRSRAQLAWIAFKREPLQWLAILGVVLIVLVNEIVFD